MTVADSLAARFYQGLAPAVGPGAPPGRPPAEESGAAGDAAGRGGFLGEAARGFLDTLRAGETTAMKGLAGRADMQSVVTALAATEIAVQTAVTMRDKVVEAYQEILRMPV